MNKANQCELSTGLLIILLMGFGGQVNADSDPRKVSYSHDHWPTRWSSAIHQQQTARFPTRNEVKTSPAELPEAVFEQDLFFSPSMENGFDRGGRQHNYGRRQLKQRFSRDSGRYIRDAAFAYQAGFGAPLNNFGGNYGGNYGGSNYMYPFAAPIPAMDPVLGFPGIGIPMMPGVPGAYPMGIAPFGGMPFGYPGSMGMWNPPFGAW